MDKIYEQTMLYDFYGELLTEHQRSVYEDALYRDMSLGEIAEERGISRQGVHDLIRRCERILRGYEDKLHLVEKFSRAKKTVEEIGRLTGEAAEDSGTLSHRAGEPGSGGAESADAVNLQERLRAVRRLSQELLEQW